ncbi:MAG: tellurite resistance TerB C-terminal domain-containing protein, partial [Lachnoanaerobaculum saburreum]
IENAAQIKSNLNRWYFEYAVIKGFSAEEIKGYIGEDVFKRDEAIEIFKRPENHSDNDIFDALVFLLGSRVTGSLSVKKQKENMIYIFAYVWKAILKAGSIDGQTVFTHCFSRIQIKRWYPLGNTPCLEETREGTDYVLNSVRSYHYSKQVWKEKSYSKECFDRKKLTSVFREIDRYMRVEYKLGYCLKEREEDKWIRDYVKEAFDKAVLELNKNGKKQIDIDFFALNKIRSDADITRESLIVEESEDTIFDISDMTDNVKIQEEEIVKPDMPTDMDINIRILECILAGEDYKHYIKENNLFASIVTDTLNERFFDDIGDNILECGGEDIYLIEDYKEDVLDIMERL